MLFLAFILLCIGLYCTLARLFHVPPFCAAQAFRPPKKAGKIYTEILDSFATKVALHLPMGIVKQSELQKLLAAANIQESPKEHMAQVYIRAGAVLLLLIPALFIHPVLCLLPVGLCWFICNHAKENLKKVGDRRKNEIEKELPRFVSYLANTLKTQRNVISCFDAYKVNYDSALTKELSVTVADMRTGNAELALQRLELRINSPYMSQLVRGLLSAMRGNDMYTYFDNLSFELTNVWEQRLRAQALRQEPRIARMSYLLFGLSLVTVFIVLGTALLSAATVFGGM